MQESTKCFKKFSFLEKLRGSRQAGSMEVVVVEPVGAPSPKESAPWWAPPTEVEAPEVAKPTPQRPKPKPKDNTEPKPKANPKPKPKPLRAEHKPVKVAVVVRFFLRFSYQPPPFPAPPLRYLCPLHFLHSSYSI